MSDFSGGTFRLTSMQRRAVEAASRGETIPGLSREALIKRLRRAAVQSPNFCRRAARGRTRCVLLGDRSV